uniref:Probable ATP-dependent transporter ycf16 n=1 Tax=Spyridia filamentosa TaxID=196632 RepID=A0A1Z1MJS7_SPYFI|nr:Iron-sulfur cluster formation ABC transporterATP-binding subunit [Spyridia filamentosa]ARW66196.1 Iron-sulfur cluster formation ABC transporterATP-binding subunit [Spyridia filamentosa]
MTQKNHIQSENILVINDLCANINGKEIIKNLNLSIKYGEIHAIMGRNGSGKSTLAKIISGHPSYQITQGSIIFKNEDITYKEPEEKSKDGIFLAFQYPIEIPGVSNMEFLRFAYNAHKNTDEELDPLSFLKIIQEKLKKLNINEEFLNRNVNEGFSGGEKKKNEILQMLLIDSKICILDETDSGLDIDALKIISNNINGFHDKNKAILLITHYQRLLDYITPNYVHIMENGKIIYTGNANTAKKLEECGYNYINNLI